MYSRNVLVGKQGSLPCQFPYWVRTTSGLLTSERGWCRGLGGQTQRGSNITLNAMQQCRTLTYYVKAPQFIDITATTTASTNCCIYSLTPLGCPPYSYLDLSKEARAFHETEVWNGTEDAGARCCLSMINWKRPYPPGADGPRASVTALAASDIRFPDVGTNVWARRPGAAVVVIIIRRRRRRVIVIVIVIVLLGTKHNNNNNNSHNSNSTFVCLSARLDETWRSAESASRSVQDKLLRDRRTSSDRSSMQRWWTRR